MGGACSTYGVPAHLITPPIYAVLISYSSQSRQVSMSGSVMRWAGRVARMESPPISLHYITYFSQGQSKYVRATVCKNSAYNILFCKALSDCLRERHWLLLRMARIVTSGHAVRVEAELRAFQTAVHLSVTDVFIPYILKYCKENIWLVLSGVKPVTERVFSR